MIEASGFRRPRTAWPNDLTDREVEVLRLTARGLSNKQIASSLVVSPRTVQNHLAAVYTRPAGAPAPAPQCSPSSMDWPEDKPNGAFRPGARGSNIPTMTTTTHTNYKATVSKMYEAFGHGDVAGILSQLSKDITWDVTEEPWTPHAAGVPWLLP